MNLKNPKLCGSFATWTEEVHLNYVHVTFLPFFTCDSLLPFSSFRPSLFFLPVVSLADNDHYDQRQVAAPQESSSSMVPTASSHVQSTSFKLLQRALASDDDEVMTATNNNVGSSLNPDHAKINATPSAFKGIHKKLRAN